MLNKIKEIIFICVFLILLLTVLIQLRKKDNIGIQLNKIMMIIIFVPETSCLICDSLKQIKTRRVAVR